jgi:moderate conductance mechanosensitive channel
MPQSLGEFLQLIRIPSVVSIIHIVSVILIGYIVLKIVDSTLKRLPAFFGPVDSTGRARAQQRTETLRQIVRSISRALLVLIVLLSIGDELGYNIQPILAGAGIVGLAVGFGAQSLVKDVISGFFILVEDQYGVGDVVRIGDFSGVVEMMTLRSTVLRNLEGQVHIVPNGNIQHVTVMTKDWARAVLDVTVRYDEQLSRIFDALDRVGKRLSQDHPDRVLEKPTVLGVEKLDDTGVTVRSIVKTPPFKQADVLREWRRGVKEEFDRCGIQFAQKVPTA